MNSKTTFGPVASRRFGLSLGIDLSPSEKSCNFDCLYCELPKAKKKDTINNPPKIEEIIADIKESIKKHSNIEVLTVTANGEPTLYPQLKELVDTLKQEFDLKLLILTNGSNLYKKDIQEILKGFDTVKVSLDSVNDKSFIKIDRPIDRDLKQLVNGIIEFSKEFKNNLVIEILVVSGVNDFKEDFVSLNEVLQNINPARVDLGTIERPPAYDVQPVTFEKLKELSDFIQNQNINIVGRKKDSKKGSYSEEEILKTIEKRPLSEQEVETLFDEKTMKLLQQILSKGAIVRTEKNNQIFYQKSLDI
jgi:wyosine [tRNA(Phe)-imidazoG37] synthetase (radical SAM superfamily)